ncbi:MAG: PAS domain S-box-containing protein, partial [Natronomonas sp.]
PTFRPGDSLAWEAFETGETVQYDDVSAVPGRLNPDTVIRSEMIVPVGDHGVTIVGSTESGTFDMTDVSLVETLASHAETALDRIERERELAIKTQRLDAVLDNTTTPMFMKDDDGHYIFVNRGYRELFELQNEPIAGQTDYDLHPSEMAAKFQEDDKTVIERGEPLETEEKIIADGEHRWVLVTKAPIYDTGERSDPETPVAVFGVASDITELRRRERHLQRERDRLDEFASIISHDLRNPLNVAVGRLELLEEDCESPHLEPAERALSRMNTLIEDLLTLAREGDEVGDTEPVDLAHLTETCWRNVDTADATVVTDLERTVYADRSRLQQLFENLFRNAVEHGSTSPQSSSTPEDVEHAGGDVTVTVGELNDGFYVEDDGQGIPANERETVFDAGYSTAEDGTGFGLSIVNQVAKAHGWDVTVTGGSEGGARFEITGVEFTGE